MTVPRRALPAAGYVMRICTSIGFRSGQPTCSRRHVVFGTGLAGQGSETSVTLPSCGESAKAQHRNVGMSRLNRAMLYIINFTAARTRNGEVTTVNYTEFVLH
jgi:hypothetical protein